MKDVKVLITFMLLLATPLFADEPRHMVSLGRYGLGWSAAYEHMGTKSGSPFKSVDYFLNNISLNYAYRLTHRFQLGAYYEGIHSEYKFKAQSGETRPTEIEETNYGLFLLYNFIDDLRNAWYVAYSLGFSNYEEENSHDFETAEGKAPFELDDISTIQELILGKRFSMKGMKLENLSFSPQFRIFYTTHGKDFDDQRVKNGTGVSIQPIRFDLFF